MPRKVITCLESPCENSEALCFSIISYYLSFMGISIESQGGKHPICHQLVQMAISPLVLNSSNLCKIWCFMLVYKYSDRCSQAWKYVAIKSLKKHLPSQEYLNIECPFFGPRPITLVEYLNFVAHSSNAYSVTWWNPKKMVL